MKVWAGGRLIDPEDPIYPASDPVPVHGLGLFETCAVRSGRVFALDRHLARLQRSAAALGIAVDVGAIRVGVEAVCGSDIGRIRITVGSPHGPVLVGEPSPDRPDPALYRSAWVRNERSPLTGHKSTAYAADALALADARAHGADEAVLADTRGRLSEGSTSNIWVEVDGELLTPTPASGCLPGVMRELVLEWAAQAGLPVRQQDLPWTVLDRRDVGLAVSNALRGFTAARTLDGRAVPTTPLIAAVRELVDLRR